MQLDQEKSWGTGQPGRRSRGKAIAACVGLLLLLSMGTYLAVMQPPEHSTVGQPPHQPGWSLVPAHVAQTLRGHAAAVSVATRFTCQRLTKQARPHLAEVRERSAAALARAQQLHGRHVVPLAREVAAAWQASRGRRVHAAWQSARAAGTWLAARFAALPRGGTGDGGLYSMPGQAAHPQVGPAWRVSKLVQWPQLALQLATCQHGAECDQIVVMLPGVQYRITFSTCHAAACLFEA